LDPGAFYRCNTAKVGKEWHVCGSVQVQGCEIVSTMEVDKNELINQKVPLLLALQNGGYSSCINIETCSVCVKMTDLAVLPAKDKVRGQLSSVVSGCAGRDSNVPLGMFESAGDFSNVETRCEMKCTEDCSNRGTCNSDGTCSCTQGYGSYCQYLECTNCPTTIGTCDSLTGKCKCHNDDCTADSGDTGSSKTWYAVLGVFLFFIVSAGVGYLVYKWKKNRDQRRIEALQFVADHSDGTGLSDLENFNASSDFEL
jgi:LPXTG-motif cell wall-anchored protein